MRPNLGAARGGAVKASKPKALPPPMTDSQLVHRHVQECVRWTRSQNYWVGLIPRVSGKFGVGILEANHIAKRHVDLCWLIALQVES